MFVLPSHCLHLTFLIISQPSSSLPAPTLLGSVRAPTASIHPTTAISLKQANHIYATFRLYHKLEECLTPCLQYPGIRVNKKQAKPWTYASFRAWMAQHELRFGRVELPSSANLLAPHRTAASLSTFIFLLLRSGLNALQPIFC